MSDMMSYDEMMQQTLKNMQQIKKNLDVISGANEGGNGPTSLDEMMQESQLQKQQVKMTAKTKEAEKVANVNVQQTFQVQKNQLKADKGLGAPDGGNNQPKGFFAKLKSTFKGSSATGKVKTTKKTK